MDRIDLKTTVSLFSKPTKTDILWLINFVYRIYFIYFIPYELILIITLCFCDHFRNWPIDGANTNAKVLSIFNFLGFTNLKF